MQCLMISEEGEERGECVIVSNPLACGFYYNDCDETRAYLTTAFTDRDFCEHFSA